MSTTPTPEEIIAHLRAELAEAHALNDKLAPLQAIIECAGSDALNQAVSAIRETQAQLRSAERTIVIQRDHIFAINKELDKCRRQLEDKP